MRRATYETASAAERFIVPPLREAISESLRTYIAPLGKGTAILDVGCGEQPLRSLVEQSGHIYVSFDVQQNSRNSVDFIGEIDKPIGHDVFSKGPYGGIVCTEVLEHVLDWPAAFSNIARLLTDGGVALITTPFVYMPHEEPKDYWRPTIHAFAAHMTAAGLRPVEIRTLGLWPDVVGTVLADAYSLPAARRTASRLANRLIWAWRAVGLQMMKSPWLRRHVKFHSTYYSSTLVVAKKCRE
jgi:cyclopropane fatty-acyl-phospholipid synthase-like methyltransferase